MQRYIQLRENGGENNRSQRRQYGLTVFKSDTNMMYDKANSKRSTSLKRDLTRFWKRVDVKGLNDCWHWTGSLVDGYGRIKFQDQIRPAHCVSYFLKHNEWPHPLGRHICDVRHCVNPAHIIPGTHADNMRDKVDRGRQAQGEGCFAAKLTADIVSRCRDLYTQGHSYYALAKVYGVNRSTMRRAILGETWSHVGLL